MNLYYKSLLDTGNPPVKFCLTKQEFNELRDDYATLRSYDVSQTEIFRFSSISFNGVPIEIIPDKKKKSRLPEWF